MVQSAAPVQERRKFPRIDLPSRIAINLREPHALVTPQSVNLSEGGLCLRLQELLEVRSLVRFQLTSEAFHSAKRPRSVECTGRVAWVIQRLDLRDMPPFLYDVGIEFVDPPPLLRQFIAQLGGHLSSLKGRTIRERILKPVLIRGRRFIPRLERDIHHPLRWHLVVAVDSTPCFSGHYPSERAALAAWARFRRKRSRSETETDRF